MLTGIASLGKGYSTYKGILHGQLKNIFGKGKDIDVAKDYFVNFKKDVLPQKSSYSTTQQHLLKTKDKIISENKQVLAGSKKKTNFPLTEDEVKNAEVYFKHRVGKSDAQIKDQFKLAKFVNDTFGNEKTVPPWKGDNVFETVFRKNNPDFSYKKLRTGPEGQPSVGKLELNELIKRLHKDELVEPEAFKNLNVWNKIRSDKSSIVAFQNRLDNMKSLYKKYSVKIPKTALDENPNAQSIADYNAFVKSWEETTGKPYYYAKQGKRGPEISKGFIDYVRAFNKQEGTLIPTPHEHQKLFSPRPFSSKIGSEKYMKRQKTTLESSPELHAMMDDPKYSKMIERVFGDRFERLHVLGEALEGRKGTFGAAARDSQLRKIKNLMTRYEMIPKELVDKIRRPQIAGTRQQNQNHIDIEYPLIEALVRRFDILGYKFTSHGKVKGTGRLKAGGTWSPESTRTSPLTATEKGELSYLDLIIKDAHNALERSGLETTFYSPINKKLVTFGQRPYSIMELRKRFLDPEDLLVRNRGGLINGHLTDTIPPERGPMPQGLPLLDPLESIERSQRQHFPIGGAVGAGKLWGALSKVPRAVARFGDIKKPKLIKPTTKTELAVAQAVEDKPAMYLESVKVIEEAPDSSNLSADEWLGYIKNKDVSETELDEFGLGPLLKDFAAKSPTAGASAEDIKAASEAVKKTKEAGAGINKQFSAMMKKHKGDIKNPEVIAVREKLDIHRAALKEDTDILSRLEGAGKVRITKAKLIEMYDKEMPKIDMDIAIAEPVSRGAGDIAGMLLKVRERGGGIYNDSDLADIFSNDARLLGQLHQPPQDRIGFVLRNKLIDIMKGTTKVVPRADDDPQVIKLLEPRGKQEYMFQTRESSFKDLWETAFPNLFHTTNQIVKQGHFDDLKHLVKAEDVTELAKARDIPEEVAFKQLYQALNIFDRSIMTADVPIPFWTKKLLYRLGDMNEGRGFFYKSKRTPAHEGTQFIPGGSGYGELKFYQNFTPGSIRAAEKQYKSGHFSGEVYKGNTGSSPFVWTRFSERIDESGRKLLLGEEIQSDLHQGVAQKGYNYAPRLDKHDVLAEMGEFAKQLDTKTQTLESTRLRKDVIKALPRHERESPANVAELKNIEKAIKKLIKDVKTLKGKVEAQAKKTGKSGQVYPDTAFKKSENYAKLAMQGLIKMASDKGYDGVALSTGRMKKTYGDIPKGGAKFYDEIGVKAMERIAKKSGYKLSYTTIVDGKGYSWEKVPVIIMRDVNTGKKLTGDPTIPVYKKGGIVDKKMVKK